MPKYHINPKTGRPGICRATKSCRFGADNVHYESKDAALKAIEENLSLVNSTIAPAQRKTRTKTIHTKKVILVSDDEVWYKSRYVPGRTTEAFDRFLKDEKSTVKYSNEEREAFKEFKDSLIALNKYSENGTDQETFKKLYETFKEKSANAHRLLAKDNDSIIFKESPEVYVDTTKLWSNRESIISAYSYDIIKGFPLGTTKRIRSEKLEPRVKEIRARRDKANEMMENLTKDTTQKVDPSTTKRESHFLNVFRRNT